MVNASLVYRLHIFVRIILSDTFRDWLTNPKSNGYEALHCTVMSSQGKWVEIQIRSQRMDDIAEKGLAAHYKYKEVKDE